MAPTKFPNQLIKASAGSGKTFQLTNRYLGIASATLHPEEILATTFTRKAAGEILDRIMLRLAEAAAEPKCLAELNKFLEGGKISPARCLETLRSLPENLHRLQVKTLDSHFIRLAQTFSFELGLPPDWTIIEDLDDQQLRSQAIESILAEEEAATLISLVHLLSKGATDRSVSRLIQAAVDDLYNVMLQTDETAWQIMERPAAVSDGEVESALQSIESFPTDKTSMQKAIVGDCQNFAGQQWAAFFAKGISAKVAAGETKYSKMEIPDELVTPYQTLIKAARHAVIGTLIYQTEAARDLLLRFDRHYQRLKRQGRGYRFDDVTRVLAAPQFVNVPSDNLFRLDGRIDHLLLDEFQDTSPQQWEAIRPIAERVTDGSPHHSFFCVGDMKQAIYAWRGGVAEIFGEVKNSLANLTERGLAKSFRSSPVVIETVNQVFEALPKREDLDTLHEGVQHWSEFFERHETARTDKPGYTCLETAPLDREGEPSATAVLEHTARKIQELHQAAPHLTIGVLVRRNQTVAEMIYHLRALGVPASEEGGNPLTDSAAVQVMLSLLTWLDHPGDLVSLFHVTNSPLAVLLEDSAQQPDWWREKMTNTLRRELLSEGYGPTIHRWAGPLFASCNPRERRRLEQLERLAYGYQNKAGLRTRPFIQLVETQRVADAATSKVRVMNVHQSKGLEFDAVFLPELDGRIPGQPPSFVIEREGATGPITGVCHYASQDIQTLLPDRVQTMFNETRRQDVVEQLCVLYVALTRAVSGLYMIIQPRKPETKSSAIAKSFAGLLLRGLNPTINLTERQTLFTAGDAKWYESAEVEHSAEPTAPSAKIRQPIQFQASDADEAAEMIAPSSLEGGGARLKVTNLLATSQESYGLTFGTMVHNWCERVVWLEETPPDEAAWLAKAKATYGHTINLKSAFDTFTAILESDAGKLVFSRPEYEKSTAWFASGKTIGQAASQIQVRPEMAYTVHVDAGYSSGTVDRLVLLMDGKKVIAADIIDFKTDSIPGAKVLKEKVEYYRPQLNAYRAAMAQMFRLPTTHVRARLLFTASRELVDVE